MACHRLLLHSWRRGDSRYSSCRSYGRRASHLVPSQASIRIRHRQRHQMRDVGALGELCLPRRLEATAGAAKKLASWNSASSTHTRTCAAGPGGKPVAVLGAGSPASPILTAPCILNRSLGSQNRIEHIHDFSSKHAMSDSVNTHNASWTP